MGFVKGTDVTKPYESGSSLFRGTPDQRAKAKERVAKIEAAMTDEERAAWAAHTEARRVSDAKDHAQRQANEGSIQHGRVMSDTAAKARAEGTARDLGSTPEASADVAIDTAAGRSKRKRQVFGNAAQSGVNI